MFTPRPRETNPFHPLEQFLITKQFLHLWECVHPCGTNNYEYMTIAPVPLFKNSNQGPELFPIINRQEKNVYHFSKSSHFSNTRVFFCAQYNSFGLLESFLCFWHFQIQPQIGHLSPLCLIIQLLQNSHISATFRNPLRF